MHTSTIEFSSMNMGYEWFVEGFLGENTSFVGEPVVGVNDVRTKLTEVLFDKILVCVLDVANGKIIGGGLGRDDFVANAHIVVGAAKAINRV